MDEFESKKGSISRLLQGAKEGDEPSLELLFNRFRSRLIRWAHRELDPRKCRDFDADDIAIEAFHSFCLGLNDGKFPKLEERHGLQTLLATITIRKAINRIEMANAQKRGEGRIGGESVFDQFDTIASTGLTPEEQAILDDEIDYCINRLPENLRDIAQRLLLGYSASEIANELGCSTRSIQLKKKQIFHILTQENSPDGNNASYENGAGKR